jgi:hypothetical protein
LFFVSKAARHDILHLVPRLTDVELYFHPPPPPYIFRALVLVYLNIRITLSFTGITKHTPLCDV